MAEFQFRLHVDPLLKWDSLNAQVRKYLENAGDSIDIAPIISRYTGSVSEFYGWLWFKVEEKMKPDRVEYDAHVAELMVYGEEVFLTPDWIRQPRWRATARVERRAMAASLTSRDSAASLGARPPVVSRHCCRRPGRG